jgi:hypothetical protein
MKTQTSAALTAVLFATFTFGALADDTSDLIALDKKWGEAGMKADTKAASALLSDKLVSVGPEGVTDLKGELAGYEPAPAGATYDVSDYKVTFLDPNTAIMTHSVAGEMAHYSMHVWSKKGGKWKVVATATTPAATE